MSYGNKNPNEKPTIKCGKGRTKQSFQKETNINSMVAAFKKTGQFPNVSTIAARYADVSNVTPYREALQQVIEAQTMFGSLPSALRTRFHNDPGELLDFVNDEKNRDEAIKLRLVKNPEKKSVPATPEATGKTEPEVPSGSTEPKAKEKTPKLKK